MSPRRVVHGVVARRPPWPPTALQGGGRRRCCASSRHGDGDAATPALPRLSPWRVWPSAAEVRRIDVLTYRLGRYPPRLADSNVDDSATAAASAPRSVSKSQRLNALRAQQQQRLRGATVADAATHDKSNSDAAALRRRVEERRPHTPYDEAAAAAAEDDGGDDEEAAATTTATDNNNDDDTCDDDDDEATTLRCYGMGAFVSPHVAGFDGHFRQQWRDFCVTEMRCDAGGGGGRAVSRDFCFDIPPPPPWLMPRCEQQEQQQQEEQQQHEQDDAQKAAAAGPRTTRAFFEVDVDERVARHLRDDAAPTATATTTTRGDAAAAAAASGATFYLECTLHKQHVAHGVALARVAQVLRLHPRALSVSGIKDYVGDTVQRLRLRNVSPLSARRANAQLSLVTAAAARDADDGRITLSDFAYTTAPLLPGDHFGNHFRIVLRGVTAPRAVVRDALAAFARHGFANYYGCQRFSWFAGADDAAWALVRHNWLAFAFRFLNYTADPALTLRALLQRPRKYPLPLQDEYRRRVVRRLRHIGVSPDDLDVAPFLRAPALTDTSVLLRPDGCASDDGGGNSRALHGDDGGSGVTALSTKQRLVLWQLRGAFFDLGVASRRLLAQRLSSYLWNQVLTMRLRRHHRRRRQRSRGGSGGGDDDVDMPVLPGDWVASAEARQLARDAAERAAWRTTNRHLVADDEAAGGARDIRDVVHPGFGFDGIALPRNEVATYYARVCAKYGLDWHARHSRTGLRDFLEPPRPIVRHPIGLTHVYDEAASTLTVCFALERGCYANVAVTELLKAARCVGADDVAALPLPASQWDALGSRDAGRVPSFRDIYGGFIDGVGFWDEHDEPPPSPDQTPPPPWERDGALFLPDAADPYRVAAAWGRQHLLRNMRRRIADADRARDALFEQPLAANVDDDEVARYAGHVVPLSPNMSARRVFRAVLRRKRRFPGAPATTPRLRRGAALPASSASRRRRAAGGDAVAPAPFRVLNGNAWNVTW